MHAILNFKILKSSTYAFDLYKLRAIYYFNTFSTYAL